MSNIFFVNVKTQFQNLGDALINRQLILLLASRGVVYVNISHCPAEFLKWLSIDGVQSVKKVNSLEFFIKKAMYLAERKNKVSYLFNPGGYVGEISKVSYIFGLTKLIFLNLLNALGMKFYMIGFSVEALGKRAKRLLKIKSNLCEVLAVRDTSSIQVLKEIGALNFELIPDLAFGLDSLDSQLSALPDKNVSRAICISFREIKDKSRLIKSISKLHEVGYEISASSQVKMDKQFNSEIIEKVHGGHHKIDFDSIADAVAYYSRFKYVVSNRLHVLLLAMYAGSIPVPYLEGGKNEKIRSLFKTMGIENYVYEDSTSTPLNDFIERLSAASNIFAMNNREINFFFDRQFSNVE